MSSKTNDQKSKVIAGDAEQISASVLTKQHVIQSTTYPWS